MVVYGIVALCFVEIGIFGLWEHIIQRVPPLSLDEIIKSSIPLPPDNEGRICFFEATSIPAMSGYKLMRGYIGT